jgi:hypothetical protein
MACTADRGMPMLAVGSKGWWGSRFNGSGGLPAFSSSATRAARVGNVPFKLGFGLVTH